MIKLFERHLVNIRSKIKRNFDYYKKDGHHLIGKKVEYVIMDILEPMEAEDEAFEKYLTDEIDKCAAMSKENGLSGISRHGCIMVTQTLESVRKEYRKKRKVKWMND